MDECRGRIHAGQVLSAAGLVASDAAGMQRDVVQGRKVTFDKVSYNALCFAVEAATSYAEPAIELDWIRLGCLLAVLAKEHGTQEVVANLSASATIATLEGKSDRDLKHIARIYDDGNCIHPGDLETLVFDGRSRSYSLQCKRPTAGDQQYHGERVSWIRWIIGFSRRV